MQRSGRMLLVKKVSRKEFRLVYNRRRKFALVHSACIGWLKITDCVVDHGLINYIS